MYIRIVLLAIWACLYFNGPASCADVCVKWNKASRTMKFVEEIYDNYGSSEGKGAARLMKANGFSRLLKSLNIGSISIQCEDDDDECLDNKLTMHGVSLTDSKDKLPKRRKRAAEIHGDEEEEEEEKRRDHKKHWREHLDGCYKTNAFLDLHGVNVTRGISEADFVRMCPSLVQQIDKKVCVHEHKKLEHGHEHLPSQAETWGYGFISITLISLLSLSVIAIIPCLKKSYYHKIMAFLVALAVGTLAGDAMLHLIPHAFVEGANSVTGIKMTEATMLKQHYSQVWRALMVLLGMYVFFVVEQLMKLKFFCCKGGGGHTHGGGAKDSPIIPHKEICPDDDKDKDETAVVLVEMNDTSSDGKIPLEHSLSCVSDVHNDHNHDDGDEHNEHFHADDRHHHHHHTEKTITKETNIAAVAWMVIVGDGFHNFSDGLAVGAAFSASISSGVSTAIAVFCHELPHELGDFAILVKSGMSIRQAVTYNLVSAVLAYVGLVVGILAGGNELGRHFILSVTAGLFLYVSLADMLPELTHQDVPHSSRCSAFICQHLGILTGVAIMLFISLYEHQM